MSVSDENGTRKPGRRLPALPWVVTLAMLLALFALTQFLGDLDLISGQPAVDWKVEVERLPVRGRFLHLVTASVENLEGRRLHGLNLDFRLKRDRDAQLNNVKLEGVFEGFDLETKAEEGSPSHQLVRIEPLTFHVRTRVPVFEAGAKGRILLVIEGKPPHVVERPRVFLDERPAEDLKPESKAWRSEDRDLLRLLLGLAMAFVVGLAFGHLPGRSDVPTGTA